MANSVFWETQRQLNDLPSFFNKWNYNGEKKRNWKENQWTERTLRDISINYNAMYNLKILIQTVLKWPRKEEH